MKRSFPSFLEFRFRVLFTFIYLYLGGIATNAQTVITQTNGTFVSGTDFSDGDIYADSGGTDGNYVHDELSTIDFCPTASETLTITFTDFDLEANSSAPGTCWDILTISGADSGNGTYSGDDYDTSDNPPNVQDCIDATANGVPTLGPFTSTGTCISFTFDSDNNIAKTGWAATLSLEGGCSADNTFNNGAGDGLWSNAANWSEGCVPDNPITSNVVIDSDVSTAGLAPIEVGIGGSLSISSGVTFTHDDSDPLLISAGGTLTNNGTLVNNSIITTSTTFINDGIYGGKGTFNGDFQNEGQIIISGN